MIKAFISEVGGGRTICSVAECVAQTGKKVAFVSCETAERVILSHAGAFGVKCKNFTAFSGRFSTPLQLYKKLEKISEDYDLICIDAPYVFKNIDYEKLEDACLGSFMNQCSEVWITVQANRSLSNQSVLSISAIEKVETKFENIKIKQICKKIDSTLMPGSSFLQAIDLETKEVKTYNLTKLFKNK